MRIFRRIPILLLIAVGITGTVLGQSAIPDSCICYTDKQDIRAIQCLLNYPILDSINQDQGRQIASYKHIMTGYDMEVREYQQENGALNHQLGLLDLKYKATKKLCGYGIPAFLITGFIVGYGLGNK